MLCCVLLFFLLIRPPPTSTLFPYTTLFRSSQIRFRSGAVAQVWNCMSDPLMGYDGVVTGTEGSAWLDRKSTRLNSSHLGISYAVFCLKKKTDGLKVYQFRQYGVQT